MLKKTSQKISTMQFLRPKLVIFFMSVFEIDCGINIDTYIKKTECDTLDVTKETIKIRIFISKYIFLKQSKNNNLKWPSDKPELRVTTRSEF